MTESSDLGYQRFERIAVGGVDEFSTGREFTLGIKFTVRAKRDSDAVDVPGRPVTGSLCDVRRNRHRRFPHLISETKVLPLRKVLSDIVDTLGEIHRALPDNEVPEARDF